MCAHTTPILTRRTDARGRPRPMIDVQARPLRHQSRKARSRGSYRRDLEPATAHAERRATQVGPREDRRAGLLAAGCALLPRAQHIGVVRVGHRPKVSPTPVRTTAPWMPVVQVWDGLKSCRENAESRCRAWGSDEQRTGCRPHLGGRGARRPQSQGIATPLLPRAAPGRCKARRYGAQCDGRYWARTSDLRLVEAALSQLS
jgi:hypothetical protein